MKSLAKKSGLRELYLRLLTIWLSAPGRCFREILKLFLTARKNSVQHSWASAEFLDFLLATREQLPDCHSRLLSFSSAIGCPMWPLLQWLWKVLSIGPTLTAAPLTMYLWSMFLWNKLRSPVYRMHLSKGSGLLWFANLLGASGWLHSILEGSPATTGVTWWWSFNFD